MATYVGLNGSASPPRSPDVTPTDRQRMTLDNLLRRELHVGDPTDPSQIAQALSERYRDNVRMQAIDGEARGLPFLRTPMLRPVDITTPVATNIDLDQSRADVNADLQKLIADNEAKEIRPELEGWQSVINRCIDEGVAAARFGLDPMRRDTTFAMRKQLGEYARLSRLIGALTPNLNVSFRDLAQSIDESCAVMLVLMGESMANLGFAGGRFLLQAPYSELQARRDAVINALRQVEGISAQSMVNGVWPRGLRAYRQLYTMLEAKGQGDLRSLLSENELARTMDELIQLAGGGSASGMRALGATAWAPLNRLNRFVQSTIPAVTPASPELATFHEALQLFIDGFVPAGGFRLLRVARPTVLNYGLYGSARITAAERRLIDLVNHRGTLARQLDLLTDGISTTNTLLAQIVLDKMLYDIDRSIDFYCVGDADLGLPELRAAAVSHMLDFLIGGGLPWPLPLGAPVAPPYLGSITADISNELNAIRGLLRPLTPMPNAYWEVGGIAYNAYLTANQVWPGGSPTPVRFAQVLHDELCLQRETDQQWRLVFEQMTTGLIRPDMIFNSGAGPLEGCLPSIVDCALWFIQQNTLGAPVPVPMVCIDQQAIVPRDPDMSLERISDAF